MCTEQSPQKRLPFAAVLSGHKGTIFPCEAAIILSLTTQILHAIKRRHISTLIATHHGNHIIAFNINAVH